MSNESVAIRSLQDRVANLESLHDSLVAAIQASIPDTTVRKLLIKIETLKRTAENDWEGYNWDK